MIERVALDALLLRTQLPELSLREGAERRRARRRRAAERTGCIVLAGRPARRPAARPRSRPGRPSTSRRGGHGGAGHAAARPAGGAAARRRRRRPSRARRTLAVARAAPPRRRAATESATVALAFDSAVLGRLDLRIDLARGRVQRDGRGAAAGRALDARDGGRAGAEDALAEKTGRPAPSASPPRRDPFDAYA